MRFADSNNGHSKHDFLTCLSSPVGFKNDTVCTQNHFRTRTPQFVREHTHRRPATHGAAAVFLFDSKTLHAPRELPRDVTQQLKGAVYTIRARRAYRIISTSAD